jgi:homoserine kinase
MTPHPPPAAADDRLAWPGGPVTVRVPASSANLGPGFDSLGLALGLYDTVEARVLPDTFQCEVFTGYHSARPQPAVSAAEEPGLIETNLVFRSVQAGFAAIGVQPPGLSLRCYNQIPQGYGLGSSAGAIVAGLVGARALAVAAGKPGALPDQELFELACELEGHPDNVAACFYGGLTVAWQASGGVRAARLVPQPGLAPVLCVPAEPLPTVTARQALPAQIPHASAAANAARAALLIAALTSRPDLLLPGTEDFLHQPYRAASMPASTVLMARLRDAGLAAAISGAGPAVLVLTMAGQHPGAAEVAQLAADADAAWQVLPLPVDSAGATELPGRSAS